jgi:predicted permease
MHPERWFDIVRLRLRSLLRRGAVERELDRELRFHVDQEIEKNVRLGLTPSEARSAALRRLGGIAQIQEECRDTRRTSYIEYFSRDLQYAGRTLVKTPVFTLAAIATLTLGIGANTAIFQLLDAVRLRSLPVPEPHRLAQIEIPGKGGFGISAYSDNLSYPLFQQIRQHQQAFSGIFAWNSGYTSLRIGQGAEARRVSVLGVTGEFFPTLGISPAAGRLFRSDDDLRGCPAPTVVLSYPFWQREFGGYSTAIGSRLVVEDHPLEIIGVAPAGFSGPEVGPHFDLTLPLCSISFLNNGDTSAFDRRDYSWLNVMGRLKPGWTLERATDHLRAISPSLMQATVPSGYARRSVERYLQFCLEAIPGATGVSRLREQYDRSLWLFVGLTALVLLMACANLSNLMLARAGAREREFAVRLALGAGRGRLIHQTLTEGLLLAAVGAAFGLALAAGLSRAILRFLETSGNRLHLDLTPSWRVLAFTAAVTSLACVLLSLAPALRAARGQPAGAMKAGARGLTTDRSRFGFQRLLVVVQISISLILVAGAFLFVASFRWLVTMDPGFRAQGVLQASFELGRQDRRDETVLRQLLAEVRATPQVESAASTTNFLIQSGMWSLGIRTDAAKPESRFTWVSPDFFATVGTPILAGRDFSTNDARSSPKVAIVNEIFAHVFFPGVNPIGKAFRTVTEPNYPEAEYEIVGLVKNTRYFALQAAEPPMVYGPVSQFPPGVTGTMIFIRTSAPLPAVEAAVRRHIAAWRPGTGMQFQVFQQTISDSLTRERLLAALSGFFGVLAPLLASIGLYGVLAYQTVRRRSEIGIRLALGATRGQIMQLVLKEAALLVFLGLVVGIFGSLAMAQAAASLLFGISARDPLHLGVGATALAAAAALGSMMPAGHASRLDPMNALRDE